MTSHDRGADEQATVTAPATSEFRSPRFGRGDTVDRYVVLETLGAGGMGVVYAAYDPRLDRRVALKLLHSRLDRALPGGRERLLREAQALARLDDPHVVRVYDADTARDGPAAGRVFLAMEFVAGLALDTWLAAEPRDRRAILELFVQIGRGLAAAHAAGLVHRDVKPSNVMVRDTGQAVVLDFGLARAALDESSTAAQGLRGDQLRDDDQTRDDQIRDALVVPLDALENPPVDSSSDPGSRSPLAIELTEPGTVLGTPSYMAPEQQAGHPATPASDQFSFCVALYRALYDEPPFEPSKPGGSVAVRPARADADVPAWLRRVLLRGLAQRPADRFPSMDALLRALAADPQRRRRRLALVATATLLALAAVAVLLVAWPRPGDACAAGAERLVGAWDATRRADLARAFGTTESSYAMEATQATTRGLDLYADAWAAEYRDACEATHQRGEQSPRLLDLRMACLDHRRRELGALVDLFLRDPAASLRGAARAAAALSPLDACADAASLLAVEPPPSDPETVGRLATLRDELAALKALDDAGLYQRALADIDALVDRARAFGYAPMLADSLVLAGALHAGAGDADEATRRLREAIDWAVVGRHDRVAAEAYVRLVRVAGYQRGDVEAGASFAALARGLIERLGRPDALAAALADHEATLALRRGDLAAARANGELAVALKQRAFGAEHPAVARSLLRLGTITEQAGEPAAARGLFTRALELQRRHLGDAHPDVAMNLDRLGVVELALGEVDTALDHHRRALEVLRAGLGDHPHTAAALSHLGNALAASGDLAAAAESHRESLEVSERALGPEHPHVALARSNLATSLADAGRGDEALALYEAALAQQLRIHGDAHPWPATTRFNLAEVLVDRGEASRALPLYRRALEVWRSAYGADHPLVTRGLVGVGRALNELGRPAEALDILGEAIDRLDVDGSPSSTGPVDELAAEAQREHARALRSLGRVDAPS
ncbi:MAG: serine/threonine-protein kinase [Acidobacteriota bacterium]